MYAHMSVLSTKLHENSGFGPVFVLNERQPHGLYRYDTSVWTRRPLTSRRYKVCFCQTQDLRERDDRSREHSNYPGGCDGIITTLTCTSREQTRKHVDGLR